MRKHVSTFIIMVFLMSISSTFAQINSENKMDVLIGLPLEEAHTYLLNNGFEIAHSSLFSKKQLW